VSTSTIDYDALAQKHGASVDYDALASKHGATSGASLPEDRGEIPLTSHWAATEQGLNRVAIGAQHAVQGAYNMVRHPIDTASSMISAPGQLYDQAKQIPAAIRDINASPDPTGAYLQAAGRTAGEGGGQAIATIGMMKAPAVVGDLAKKGISNLSELNPAKLKRAVGRTLQGASDIVDPDITGIASPRLAHVQRAVGRLGKAMAGSDESPVYRDATLDPNNIPEYAGEAPVNASPEAMRQWWKSRGGGLADQPIDRKAMQGGPELGQKQTLLRQAEALKQPVREVVNQAIPIENKAANALAHDQVEFYLKKGDVAGAEKALDSVASKANPEWGPERPPYRGTTNDIRNEPKVRADQVEDHAIQQEMNQNLERHGWSAESEARREFIARNSTGVTKGGLNRAFDEAMGKPIPPEKPVKYTKTPGVKARPPEGTIIPGDVDLEDILRKSLDAAKAKRR
jgi:hypothetical protein